MAGADEAGRGCLAGPLVAAAVLFDYERIGLADLRALTALNDSKQHTEEGREELYPRVLRIAAKVAITSRCVRGIDERGLHVTNLAALSDTLRRVGVDGCICLSDGFPVPPTGFRAAARRRRGCDERRHRRRVRDRQGHARPLHAPDGGALPGLGVRRPRRLLDAGAPGRDRAPRRLAPAPALVPVDGLPAAGALKQYYEQRSSEYDQWYEGSGVFASRSRPGWDEDVEALCRVVAELPPARTLDVACGTGFLTRHLRGEVVGLDASEGMIEIAGSRMPAATFVVGDALALPFADGSFDRVFTGHFYDHLQPGERERFLAEVRRVADELVVADSALREGVEPVQWQERVLNDGSRHTVYKRYFTGAGLAEELGGGELLMDGAWFVVVRVRG